MLYLDTLYTYMESLICVNEQYIALVCQQRRYGIYYLGICHLNMKYVLLRCCDILAVQIKTQWNDRECFIKPRPPT